MGNRAHISIGLLFLMSSWNAPVINGIFITPMGQIDVNLASGKNEFPFAMPFAVRDIIFGIPTNQITLAFDESSDTDELKATIELIQISNISLRNYLINTDSEQSKFFKCIKNAHSTYQQATNFIFGSVSTAEIILSKIQEYDLISRNILYIFHWSSFPVSEKFQSTVLEAMRIAVFTEHRKGTFRIYYNQAKSDGENELTLVNWWNQDKGLFRIPVFPSAASTFNNFGGRNFYVPVLHKPPWNFVTYENGTFYTDGGRDDQLLKLLASKLNFRFEYFDPPERIQGLGVAVNGTFRGVLGLIGRREAPFFLGDVTITYERLQIVDFSSPTLGDCGTFATHSPRLLNEALALVRPFHWQVWLPVTATALLSGPVLFTVIVTPSVWRRKERSKIKASKLLQDCIWFSVGMFLKQSVKEPSRMHKARLLMILLSIIATYVIGGLYSATLTSLLARPAREKPIRTLFDLEEAMKNKGYQLLVEKHSSSLSILRNGTGIYGRLWRAMRGSDVLVGSVEEGMRRVQDGTSMAAIFAGRETLFFDARRFGAHHFYLGDCLFTRYSAIAMQMGSPFLENFDQLIIRLFEAGILTKMTRDEYERLREKVDKVNGTRIENEEESDMDNAEDKIFKTSDHSVRSYSNDEASGMKNSKSSQGSTGGNDGERKSMKAVSIKMLQGPFYVLLIGYSISCLVLYGERVVASHQKYKGDHQLHTVRSSCCKAKIPCWKLARNWKKFWQLSSKGGPNKRKPMRIKGGKSFLTSRRVRFSYHE